MPSRSGRRADLVADGALALLAECGMRGLTHRAVDARLGLPQGSTSNLVRTRLALLELAVRRQSEREATALFPAPEDAPVGDPGALAAALARQLHRAALCHRELLLSYGELALEATRRPSLRAGVEAGRGRRLAQCRALLSAAGCTDPHRHAPRLLAWYEGAVLRCAVDAAPSALRDLREEAAAVLGTMHVLTTRGTRRPPGSPCR